MLTGSFAAAQDDKPLLVICGPTASGKTELGLKLAHERGGEIINADMGQLYRGMNIGTAKPTAAQFSIIPFHLIDVIDPPEQFSAALFREAALRLIVEIRARGKIPVIVGGTGLYLKALTQGLFAGPGRDDKIREALESRAKRDGLASLYKELEEKDATAAAKLHVNDRLRIIRALEVLQLTGRPISSFQTQWGRGEANAEWKKIAINWPREELYQRIEARVSVMLANGWMEETEQLVKRWGPEAYALQRCIGYREIIDHLKGELSRNAMVEQINQRSRQYAKRQLTWFRADPTIEWVRPSA